ncbi:MAG: hypothetical protein H6858_08315 [Rhodospirillales bacterium]|nr:hypothetical protein [Alphaproteobacteria bacterium]MCB1839106.1 hypothetical protein [Alphaproteobacteria bacterium]MCB9977584.1 hypothetical protein [Rhodospirillales bacterium]
MFQEAFKKLDINEVAEIVDQVNKQVDGSLFDPLETTILTIDLSFYPEYRFLDIADHATSPPLQRYVLQKGADFILLDWTYRPIYKINEKAPIALNANNVLDYTRFFFSNVRGRHGRFLITESLENIRWKEEPSPAERKSYGKLVQPLKIIDKLKHNVFKLEARMMLKDTLFKADIYVEPNGKVVLANHEILLEKMPVLDHVTHQ